MTPLKILITAGPTQEHIDPIRFITNHSTGHMGYAIARKAKNAGHDVTLISGPVSLKKINGVKTIQARTARAMFAQVQKHIKGKHCLVMAAAVADFSPLAYKKSKIKKSSGLSCLELKRNPDILSWAGKHKQGRILVGFCMETESLLARAREKLESKKADIIIANKVAKSATPFGKGSVSVVLLDKLRALKIKSASKSRVAGILLDKIQELWYKKHLCKRS